MRHYYSIFLCILPAHSAATDIGAEDTMTAPARPLILPDAASGCVHIGHRITGTEAGPTLLVTCFAAPGTALMQDLAAIPRIGGLRGSLAIVHIDALDAIGPEADARLRALLGPIDATLFLPFRLDAAAPAPERARREMVWTTLAKAAVLGIIAGRGLVPQRMACGA